MHKRHVGSHFDWQIVGILGFSLVITTLAALGLREVIDAALHVISNLTH